MKSSFQAWRKKALVGAWILTLLLAGLIPSRAMAQTEKVQLPPGFRFEVFASDLGMARFMAFDDQGHLYVSTPRSGKVVVLPDRDGDGRADEAVPFAEGLDRPHGIAFRDGWAYVAENGRVLRFQDRDGDLKADVQEVVVPDLPRGGGHWTRTLGFGADGKLYVSAGSSCNVCVEDDPRRAAILQFNPDGTEGRIYAQGIRNAVGFVFHPQTKEIWATENGRDWLGDDAPPDEVLIVRDGGHYGWPYCHGQKVPDPEFSLPGFCEETIPPTLGLQAHSAPLGLTFYTGSQFPEEYRGDLFIAYHGSWNRSVPTGYKVVRVRMKDGEPLSVEDFLTGFLVGRNVWGRPVDLVVTKDGSLLVSDDFSGRIYRIFYEGT